VEGAHQVQRSAKVRTIGQDACRSAVGGYTPTALLIAHVLFVFPSLTETSRRTTLEVINEEPLQGENR
jgi:hypothetical protein